MKQTRIGPYPKLRPSEAAEMVEALRLKRADGIDPKEYQQQQRKPAVVAPAAAEIFTVRKLVQDYITNHIEQELQAAGALAARRALERLLDEEPSFAEMPAIEVTRSTCFDLLEARKATPTATQKLRSMLGAAWSRALDAGRLDHDTPNWWPTILKGKLKSKGKIVGGEHQGQQRRVLRD